MCGIVGVVGNTNATDILIQGLEKLEYRGYDSAGVFLAVPLAIYLSIHKRTSNWVLQIAGIFQTIPSMALLGLFIPIMGIGTLPALTALVIYAIFPILQNTITGLQGIDPSLEEAGIAFGMTKWERLKKFEIPLAMPVIMSGIRTAAVMIIGTATLAALIGAGGLGSFILLGIDRNNASLILIGALSSAFLAIAFNLLLKWMEKAKLRTIFAAFAVMVIGLGASYTPSLLPKPKKENLVIAGKLGPKQSDLFQSGVGGHCPQLVFHEWPNGYVQSQLSLRHLLP